MHKKEESTGREKKKTEEGWQNGFSHTVADAMAKHRWWVPITSTNGKGGKTRERRGRKKKKIGVPLREEKLTQTKRGKSDEAKREAEREGGEGGKRRKNVEREREREALGHAHAAFINADHTTQRCTASLVHTKGKKVCVSLPLSLFRRLRFLIYGFPLLRC